MPASVHVNMVSSPAPSPATCSNRRLSDVDQKTVTCPTSQPIKTADSQRFASSMDTSGAGYSAVSRSQTGAAQCQTRVLASDQGAGQEGEEGVVYWVPVVTVPFAESMGQVNLAWPPSQHLQGKDLPLSDVNTLRYFFNLGVEYFRISANMQKQQPPPSSPPQHHHHCQHNYVHSAPTSLVMPSGVASRPVPAPREHRAFSAARNSLTKQCRDISPTYTASACPSANRNSSAGHSSHSSHGSQSSQEGDPDPKDMMELSSDVADSGFTSGGEGGPEGEDEEGEDTSTHDVTEPQGSTSSRRGGERGAEKGARGKDKRKYYMYGNHKLIKPIKDIPPRFLALLAEMNSARARCEGQPIYMQRPPSYGVSKDSSGLNADAQCFYPAQQCDAAMMEDTALGSLPVTHVFPTHHPPPAMVPPPPATPDMEHQSPGSAATPSSLTLPGPAHHVPVPSARPAHRTLLAEAQAQDRPEQTASLCSSQSADVASSPRVPVSPNMCQGSGVPTTLPPPLPRLPVHTGHVPSSVASAEGRTHSYSMYPAQCPNTGSLPPQGQSFHVYPAHCSTPGSLPPQSHSHAHGLSQGQMVHMISPPAYGAPPACINQLSAVMPPPGGGMAIPCPPVAVQ